MYQNRPRRFRRHVNGRQRDNGDVQTRLRSDSFSNNPARNNFRTPQSAEKLLEKYNTLAKEALLSGDKTLSENYLQHADHFLRIIEDKNKSRIQTNNNIVDKPTEENKSLAGNNNINQSEKIKNKI